MNTASKCGNCKCLHCIRNVDIDLAYSLTPSERANLDCVCLNCDNCKWLSAGPNKKSTRREVCEYYIESEMYINLRAKAKRNRIILKKTERKL